MKEFAVAENNYSNVLGSYYPLSCDVCGADILQASNEGRIIFVINVDTHEYIDVFATCAGDCDEKKCRTLPRNYSTAWESIPDMSIPKIYLKKIMAMFNILYSGEKKFNEDAFNKYKDILILVSQLVFRNQTSKEIQRIDDIEEIPEGL